jgi:hypothetical protein
MEKKDFWILLEMFFYDVVHSLKNTRTIIYDSVGL